MKPTKHLGDLTDPPQPEIARCKSQVHLTNTGHSYTAKGTMVSHHCPTCGIRWSEPLVVEE